MKKAKKKVFKENELEDDIYIKGKIYLKTVLAFGFLFLIVGILANFPVKQTLKKVVRSAITANRECPIQLTDINISFFPLPSIVLEKPTISKRCYKGTEDLLLDNIELYPMAPGIFPPGIKLGSKIKHKATELKIGISLTLGTHIVRISDSKISSETLSILMKNKKVIKGNFYLNATVDISKNKVVGSKFHIKSKDFGTLPLNMMGVGIPELKIGNLSFKGILKRNNDLEITTLILGNAKSPLTSQATGNIKLKKFNIRSSKLNLSGEMGMSEALLENSAFKLVFNLFFKGHDNQNGIYQFKLTGTAAAPKFKVL